jgi:hypothetical protein
MMSAAVILIDAGPDRPRSPEIRAVDQRVVGDDGIEPPT